MAAEASEIISHRLGYGRPVRAWVIGAGGSLAEYSRLIR
jgi:hypothetical protein